MIKLISIIGIVGILIFFVFLLSQGQTPTPISESLNDRIQKIVPGETSIDDTAQLIGDPIGTPTTEGVYHFPSSTSRTTKVTSENGRVVMVKELVPISDTATKVETLKQTYGNTPNILYGHEASSGELLHVYSDQGIAFVGNPNTGYVFEIWHFIPMSLKEFITKWASDYSESPESAPTIGE